MNEISTYGTGDRLGFQNKPSSVEKSDNSLKTDKQDSEKAVESNGEITEFSSRSQKIQKLNEEFFPGGPSSIRITSAFIERLHEYGLISNADAEKLLPDTEFANQNATTSLDKLIQFTDDFAKELEISTPNSSLIDTLNKARDLLQEWTQKESISTTDAKALTSELNAYTDSEEYDSFAEDDKYQLSKVDLALRIATILSPEKSSSSQINSYLSIFDKY